MFNYGSTTLTGLAGRSTPSCVTRTRVAVYDLCILCASTLCAAWIWDAHVNYVKYKEDEMSDDLIKVVF